MPDGQIAPGRFLTGWKMSRGAFAAFLGTLAVAIGSAAFSVGIWWSGQAAQSEAIATQGEALERLTTRVGTAETAIAQRVQVDQAQDYALTELTATMTTLQTSVANSQSALNDTLIGLSRTIGELSGKVQLLTQAFGQR
jgi:hypothetical protein